MQLIHIETPEIKQDGTMVLTAWLNNTIRKISQRIEIELQPNNDIGLKRANATSQYVRPIIVADEEYGQKLCIAMKARERLIVPKNVEFDLNYFYIRNNDGTTTKIKYDILLRQ